MSEEELKELSYEDILKKILDMVLDFNKKRLGILEYLLNCNVFIVQYRDKVNASYESINIMSSDGIPCSGVMYESGSLYNNKNVLIKYYIAIEEFILLKIDEKNKDKLIDDKIFRLRAEKDNKKRLNILKELENLLER